MEAGLLGPRRTAISAPAIQLLEESDSLFPKGLRFQENLSCLTEQIFRTCSNPYPQNGGSECGGSTTRALTCSKPCPTQMQTVDQVEKTRNKKS